MRQFVEVALAVPAIAATAASAYLGTLALLALLPRARVPARSEPDRRFAVLVPAHNEERALPALLASVAATAYPASLVGITVIADNCSDATAEIARRSGANVIERRDERQIGKGYALAYALDLIESDYDAVVMLDADCVVSPNIFAAFDARIERGAAALQAYYTMRPASESATRAVRETALALVHLVRPLGKARFRGSAGLKGSGMCFTRDALERVRWSNFGLAEDVEQHIALVRAGLRVEFAAEAVVTGDAPSSLNAAGGQHRRWEAGRLSAARSHALSLVVSAVRARSLVQLDTAVELQIPPVSTLGVALPLLAAAGLLLGSPLIWGTACFGLLSLAVYFTAAVVLTRPPAGDLARGLVAMPFYMLWKVWVYAQAIVSRPGTWEATERDA